MKHFNHDFTDPVEKEVDLSQHIMYFFTPHYARTLTVLGFQLRIKAILVDRFTRRVGEKNDVTGVIKYKKTIHVQNIGQEV